MGLNCDVIKDLMPLYVDNVCSEASKEIVKEHIEHCDSCHAMLRAMMEPEKDLEIDADNRLPAKNPFKKIRRRNRILVSVAVMVTIAIMILIIALVQNVKPLYDMFFVDERIMLENTEAGEWQMIEFNNRQYLDYDKVFSKKQIVNDANSDGPITVKITEKDGTIVIPDLVLEPGESQKLKNLKRNKEYSVEYQADVGWYFINFQ